MSNKPIKCLADICIFPLSEGYKGLSKYVAIFQKVFDRNGLKYVLHSNGTNVEGKMDTVLKAVQECHEVCHSMGIPRMHSEIRLGTRIDKEPTLEDKIKSVKNRLKNDLLK
ncbi:mth1187 family thiaminee-binding protein [Anaeramoeba flamelloides]|uniref:Mth1187 family thiaminee-binding protein n=1 Tax=Anaeramoeba flamelloides TaxID=1746091 RepID=A0AAV8A2E1_9EUKA|nr:mth1187 family thiaminee-binding protein [Anaeramoeba flamelloides]KAJ6237641.1 mth1187 family thiaminee-binding protein [Anaeramoeba flamelloides]